MEEVGVRARLAAQKLAAAPLEARNAALRAIRDALTRSAPEVTAANKADLEAAKASGLDAAIYKRLVLDAAKLDSLLAGLDDLLELPDPLGATTLARELSPGLELRRRTCPIGVLCVIFEARPEAVIQIAALALKSGNAIILKGGKEAAHSNVALAELIRGALASCAAATAATAATAAAADGGAAAPEAAVPVDAVQLVSTREEVSGLLRLDKYIDLVIPRGGNALVKSVKEQTRIPVLGHADGICHVYLDAAAAVEVAVPVVVDSKTQYPAACNAAETLLVHPACLAGGAAGVLGAVAAALLCAGVTLHADAAALPLLQQVHKEVVAAGGSDGSGGSAGSAGGVGSVVAAGEGDWDREWLSLDLSVAVVPDTPAAVAWINAHGSHHTDCIVTGDAAAAAYFLANVDSAGAYHNASTRFADGFRYGFGAEVGISTNRIHARGPVGLEGLTTYKYTLVGSGQTVTQFSGGGGRSVAADTVEVGGHALPRLAYTHTDLPLTR